MAACPANKIRNPVSNYCVSNDGPTGRRLNRLAQQPAPPIRHCPKGCPTGNRPAATSCNTESGRCYTPGGALERKLMGVRMYRAPAAPRAPRGPPPYVCKRPCVLPKICNSDSGRCIKISSTKGRRILAAQNAAQAIDDQANEENEAYEEAAAGEDEEDEDNSDDDNDVRSPMIRRRLVKQTTYELCLDTIENSGIRGKNNAAVKSAWIKWHAKGGHGPIGVASCLSKKYGYEAQIAGTLSKVAKARAMQDYFIEAVELLQGQGGVGQGKGKGGGGQGQGKALPTSNILNNIDSRLNQSTKSLRKKSSAQKMPVAPKNPNGKQQLLIQREALQKQLDQIDRDDREARNEMKEDLIAKHVADRNEYREGLNQKWLSNSTKKWFVNRIEQLTQLIRDVESMDLSEFDMQLS
jgi:hypothetical protein